MSFVEFNNVTFGYKEDDYLLLEDLSFSAEKNDIITVIGASGCGKSTLFRLMTCLETEYKGSITINENTERGNRHGGIHAAEGSAYAVAEHT